MSIEVEVLSEVYTILKQYIPKNDHQEAADNLMSVIVDLLNDNDLTEFSGTDSALSKAFKDYSAEFEEDDLDDYEE